MGTLDINKVIEDFSHLTLEDKEYVAEVMHKRITEERRESIFHRAREARESLSRGEVKTGGFQDLCEDLESD